LEPCEFATCSLTTRSEWVRLRCMPASDAARHDQATQREDRAAERGQRLGEAHPVVRSSSVTTPVVPLIESPTPVVWEKLTRSMTHSTASGNSAGEPTP
jgi:hypothetical protein